MTIAIGHKRKGVFVKFEAPYYIYKDEKGEVYHLSATQMHNALRDPTLPAGTPVMLEYCSFGRSMAVWCVSPVVKE